MVQRSQSDAGHRTGAAEACFTGQAVHAAAAGAEMTVLKQGKWIDVIACFHAYKYWTTNALFPAMILYVQKRSFYFYQEFILSMKKTNAARFLDKLKIEYEIREYEVDESDLSAENVARKVDLPLDRVFKTLVARGDKTGVIMAVVSGAAEVDLKALASVSGNKKVEMVHLNEVLPLTGYIRGGVSPLGAKKNYPVYLDRSAMTQERISISAGMRGMQIVLSPAELVQATHAEVGDIGRIPVADI